MVVFLAYDMMNYELHDTRMLSTRDIRSKERPTVDERHGLVYIRWV